MNANRAGLASLRRRFPRFEENMGAAVNEMAQIQVENKPFRVWSSVEPEDPADPLPGRWIAHVHAIINETRQTFCLPVIPDEFNPRADKLIRPEDKPHVFTYMSEAEQAAEMAVSELTKYLKTKTL